MRGTVEGLPEDRMPGMGSGSGLNSLWLALNLPRLAKLYVRLFRDPRVSWVAKAVLVLSFAYLVFPLDLITDFAIGLGQLDDLAVLALGFKGFIWLCPKNVVAEHVLLIDQGK